MIIGFEMASYIGISFPSNAISLEICTLFRYAVKIDLFVDERFSTPPLDFLI